MGVGAGEGGAQPACTALARDFSPNRPTAALALMMTGNPIGSFIGIFAGGLVAEYWGWRSAFILAGLPGLLLAALLYISVREPRVSSGTSSGNWLFDAVRIVSKPGIPKLIVLCSACLFIMYSGAAWLPAHFIRVHGVTTGEMGVYAGLAIGIGGGIGCLASMICDRLSRKFENIESIFLTINMLAIIPCLYLTLLADRLPIALAGLFLFDILAYAWLAPATKLLQDAVRPEQRALAFAVCGGAGILFSLGAGLPLTGSLSDLLTPVHQSRALGISLGASITIAAIVAVATVQSLLRKTPGKPVT
jgi:predicted MFS family arabinose efflux permease